MIKKMCYIAILGLVSLGSHAANLEKLSKQKWIQITTNNFKVITDLDEKKLEPWLSTWKITIIFSAQ